MDERFDVANTVAALGLSVDTLRWNDLLGLLAPKIIVDYTSLYGGEVQTMAREDLIARWQALLPGFSRTHHFIGAVHVTLTDPFAYAEAPLTAWHIIDDPGLAADATWDDTWIVAGHYELQLEKLEGAWCIQALTLAGAWQKGNLNLRAMAIERAHTAPRQEPNSVTESSD